jgi:hypothetical protein
MNYQILRPVRLIAVFLMMTGLSVGCATVVVPLSPTDITMTDADTDHGWLLGTIHLTRHESDHTEKFTKMRMVDMKWWLEEETTGKRFHISPLPIDGPFAVKLPAGSYRVTGIGFSNMRGVWHTALPAEFRVRSRGCTSLGTWALQMQTGFFSGWITREVFADHRFTQDASESIHEVQGCPTVVAPVESPVQSSIELDVHLHAF